MAKMRSKAASSSSKPPRQTRELPQKDADVLEVAGSVGSKWVATPAITLAWMSSADFVALTARYKAAMMGRLGARGQRPMKTLSLRQLDEQIEEATAGVKIYAMAKEERRGDAALYGRFGLVRTGGVYRLPRDRQNRLSALQVMTAGVESEGFGGKEYGTAFWTAMGSSYQAALDAATDTDGRLSGHGATKNELKAELLRAMQALMWVLRGNYPDTYQLKWREWGWQKEDY